MTSPTKAAELETLLDVTLNEEQSGFIRDMLGNDPEEASSLRILVGDGHSGYGLYACEADYAEEGANFIKGLPRPAALLRASEGRVPEGLPLAVTSSPATIWLDLGFDPGEEDAHFSNLADVTWSEDNPTGHGIKYVRADLTAAPHPPAQQPISDEVKRQWIAELLADGSLDGFRDLLRAEIKAAQQAEPNRERQLYEALQTARDHIDMHSLEASHCKDWARINDALSSPPPHKAEGAEQ